MTLTPTELLQAISRVRRAMPRNADVMAICDIAERAYHPPPIIVTGTNTDKGPVYKAEYVAVPKFDKKAYQRDLMRKRRAEGKAK